MKIHWWPNATLALLNMPRAEAEAVDRAVQRWATSGEGLMIATGPAEYLLFVGTSAVVLLIEGDTLHVDAVRRA
jgi:hypothetical protein